MQQKKILINTLAIVLLVGAIVAAYFYFVGTGSDETAMGISSNQTTGAGTGVSTETSEFLILLQSLQAVELNGQIFDNNIFSSELENITTPIPSRPQGRANPFAALGVGNLASVSTSDNSGDGSGAGTASSTEEFPTGATE